VLKEAFNIGLPIAFITQKEAEVYNLTVLSLGVESAMKPEEIRSLLI
jgi:vacuolar-type H+-ATPase subunit C/Vma6